MNPDLTSTLNPDTSAAALGRTRIRSYAKLACGFGSGSPDNLVQVLGLSAGKSEGLPAVASMQKTDSAQGDWTPSYIPLTGAISPITLDDLVVCAGMNATEAAGLGSNGKIYLVGSQALGPAWAPGAGLLTQPMTFTPGSLSACLINTVTLFAVSYTKAPWVAAYRDQNQVWQPGYALPVPSSATYQSLAARPDRSNAGTTHAIGLTTDGKAAEVATARGPGTGSANWNVGKGVLGSQGGLPGFTQLLLVTADANLNFHVIGLGADGSVWDIDQYSAGATIPQWSGVSTRIAPAGTVNGSKIECYVSASGPGLALNLVAWSGSTLKVFATYGTSWAASSATIPTSGASLHWHIVNNLANGFGIFILGLSGLGHVHELAYFTNGTWYAGSMNPING